MSSPDGPQIVQPGLEHAPVYSHWYPQAVPIYGLEHAPTPHVWPQNPLPVPQHEKQAATALTGPGSSSDCNKILGLRRVTFFLVLTIALLVIAAAIGGGVAGSMVAKKKSSSNNSPSSGSSSSASSQPSPTVTPTPTISSSTISSFTSTSSSESPTNILGYTGCPGINGTIFTAASGAQFMQYCYFDITGSYVDFQYHSYVNNFDECIGYCDTVNVVGQNTQCKAVAYDYTQIVDYLYCWLKNVTNNLESNAISNIARDYSVVAILM